MATSLHLLCRCKPPRAINRVLGHHWKTVHGERARIRRVVWAELAKSGELHVRLRPPVKLQFCRMFWGCRPVDPDNISFTAKHVVDALVREGVLPDDTPEVIVEAKYEQRRAASESERGFEIRITEVGR